MDREPPNSSSDTPTPTETVRRTATSPFTGRYLLIILGVCIVLAIVVFELW